MSTPNWDVLHTRFATSVRDSVSAATDEGDELSVADRDAYLVYAYTKYVRLVWLYNPLSVNNILAELYKLADVSAVSGVIALPSDYGFFVGLKPVSFPGATVTKLEPDNFLLMAGSITHQSIPSQLDIYVSLAGAQINVLPTSISGGFQLGYIVKPKNIVQGGADDILIEAEHWDTILGLARASYYRDKHEFDIAQSVENDAITNSPFRIGEPAK